MLLLALKYWKYAAGVLILLGLIAAYHHQIAVATATGHKQGMAVVQAAWDKQTTANNAATNKLTSDLNAKVEAANEKARQRQTQIDLDHTTAAATIAKLRNETSRLTASIPSLARHAVDKYAATATQVFAECTDKYSELAGTADQLSSDRQSLIDAWPKKPN